mgnify:CR=1
MQKNKAIFYNSIFIIVQIFFPNIIKGSEILQTLQNVSSSYFFGRNVYTLGQNTNKLLNPNQERQDQIQNINEQLKLITLRKQFITCLVTNRTNITKESLGIPFECEQAAFLLASAGGIHETERMVEIFKTHTK